MVVRRVEDGYLHTPKKQMPGTKYNWHMYLRFLSEEEISNAHKVVDEWGEIR